MKHKEKTKYFFREPRVLKCFTFHVSRFKRNVSRFMFHVSRGRGFTLMELLVVISIIGILASIVLIQFPGAVSSARDGRVMSSMGQFRTQARIVYANDESYGDVECTIDSDSRICSNCNLGIKALCDDIGQNADDILEIYVDSDGKGYCASVKLNGSGKYFCIDGSGEEEGALHAKEYDIEPARCNSGYDCVAGDDCGCE